MMQLCDRSDVNSYQCSENNGLESAQLEENVQKGHISKKKGLLPPWVLGHVRQTFREACNRPPFSAQCSSRMNHLSPILT